MKARDDLPTFDGDVDTAGAYLAQIQLAQAELGEGAASTLARFRRATASCERGRHRPTERLDTANPEHGHMARMS